MSVSLDIIFSYDSLPILRSSRKSTKYQVNLMPEHVEAVAYASVQSKGDANIKSYRQ